MAALSSFASDLLEEAKHFFKKASETKDPDAKKAFLHAALMLGLRVDQCAAHRERRKNRKRRGQEKSWPRGRRVITPAQVPHP